MKTLHRIGLSLTLGLAAACGGPSTEAGGGSGSSGRGAMPPMPVEMVTLAAAPVEQTSEYVGTVKSRRQTDVQPQVEGFLTAIRVKSGDRIAAGATLMEIDSRTQQAQIVSQESVRSQREIDLQYAKQESDRQAKLLAAGAASQMDNDRATNAVKAAEAQLRTVDEQLRALRTDIGYYKVTAPQAGIIGDIPVHEGDRVTKTTLLTTIDSNAGLELYLNIPVQEAPRLKMGLPVRLLNENGDVVSTEAISFISPSVDTSTQSVLTKIPIPATGSAFRTDQYVRSRVIWNNDPGLRVPVTSVIRVNGQYFAYVAEAGQGGALIAHQRAITLGPMSGNDYVVLGGLKAGDKLITGGIQKIGDGAPVQPGAPAATPEGRGR